MRTMTAALIAAALACGTAHADQITIGNSPVAAWDIAGTGSSDPLAISGGPFSASALFDSDLGTASFGPVALATGHGSNGIFTVIAGSPETLNVSFTDGDAITGSVDWTEFDDGSLNPHSKGIYAYTASGDAAFLAAFGASGSADIDGIMATTAQTLENWDTDAGIQWSTFEIVGGGTPVSEPGTLVVLFTGLACLTAWWVARGQVRRV